jgi:hypothetical protein
MPKVALTKEIFHRTMINALEFMEPTILDVSLHQRSLWFDLIPRGTYPLGEGLVRKQHRFHGDIVDQAGLTTWQSIQTGREPGDPGGSFDACAPEAELISFAMETVSFTGVEAGKRTENVCIRDLRFHWEFRQQLGLIFGFLGEVTHSVWENHNRERYMKFCGDEGQLFVLAQGGPDNEPFQPVSGTVGDPIYDPFSQTDIVVRRDIDVGRLDWSFMTWWHQQLALQAPMGAMNGMSDDPVFGLCLHPADMQDMLLRDDDLREDYRHMDPMVLIENYGKVRMFKGFAIMNDKLAPRFRLKAGGVTSTTLKLERVLPYVTTPTTINSKHIVNSEYLNADFAMGIIKLMDVYEILVPPTISAPAAGLQFGVVPGHMGEFAWINYPSDNNILQEKGYYYARFEAFARPLRNSQYAVAFIYRRCPQTVAKLCDACETTSSAWQTITSAVPLPDTDEGESATSHTRVRVTVGTCLSCEPPAEVEVDYDGNNASDKTAVLFAAGREPVYDIAFDVAADYVDPATIVANTSQIRCSP